MENRKPELCKNYTALALERNESLLYSLGNQADAVHLSRLGQAQNLQHSRGDVGQLAALSQLAGVTNHAEGNRVGGVGGEGGTVLLIHLVRIAVVCGN